jgi:predicted alpha/beta-hydrolase family hydrolase
MFRHPPAARELIEVRARIRGAIHRGEVDAGSAGRRLIRDGLRLRASVSGAGEYGGGYHEYRESVAAWHHSSPVIPTVYSSDDAVAALLLAPGAGADQRSHFMVLAAKALAARGITTATFDFPYMADGRTVPDKPAVLEAHWRSMIASAADQSALANLPLFIGGKSMGGRIASQVAAQQIEGVRGLVFLGYPLHPPGKPEQRRDRHLPDIREPMLFVQGTRDPFGTAAEIRALLPRLHSRADLHEVADGDHSFKVRLSVTGMRQDAVFSQIFEAVAAFIRRA